MHVAEAGEGEPLLLIHGWPQHFWMWREVLPELSRTYRCIVPDLRGLGWTDAPAGRYDKPQLMEDVVALLDTLGVDRVRVAGHDWGAVVTQLLVERHPERVVKAVSMNVPSMWDPTFDPRQLVAITHMPFLSAPFADRAVRVLARPLLRIAGISGSAAEPYVERFTEPARARATVGYYRTYLTQELPRMLANRPPGPPKAPIHFMGGAADPIVRWTKGIELVPGAGHFLPEDRPDAVVERLRSFLA